MAARARGLGRFRRLGVLTESVRSSLEDDKRCHQNVNVDDFDPDDFNPAELRWREMALIFEASGLPVPPVPESLRPRLRTIERWCWATEKVSPTEMYLFDRGTLRDFAAGRIRPQRIRGIAGCGWVDGADAATSLAVVVAADQAELARTFELAEERFGR